MGTTGLIFGAIVVAWLAYLVPMYLRRSQQAARPQADPEARFSNSVQIIRDGAAVAEQASRPGDQVVISTPLTRRAAVAEICRTEQRLAGRRRNVLAVLALSLPVLLVTCALGRTPWWSLLVPTLLIAGFAGIARFSVRAMHRQFEEQLARIEDDPAEDTVRIGTEVSAKPEPGAATVEVAAPEGAPGTLWDPLPVVRPTYVQAPVAPRTVRTIDLSAPTSASEPPVTADGPGAEVIEAEVVRPRPRAVGE